ncbi:MAG: hypothetical protein AB1414_04085 [bacterium]
MSRLIPQEIKAKFFPLYQGALKTLFTSTLFFISFVIFIANLSMIISSAISLIMLYRISNFALSFLILKI